MRFLDDLRILSTADRTVEWPSVNDMRVDLFAESAQFVFLEPTDKSTEETVAILQEAIDDVGFDAKKKSLVIVGGSVGQATETLREVVLMAELQPTEVAGVRQASHCRQRRSGRAGFFDRAITNERRLLHALENAGVLNPQLVSSADTSALERARTRQEFNHSVGWRFCSRLHKFNHSPADPHVGVFFRPNRGTSGRHRCCHVCPCIGLHFGRGGTFTAKRRSADRILNENVTAAKMPQLQEKFEG